MKITAGRKLEPVADSVLQFIPEAADRREIKPVAVRGVRRGHNMGYAIGDRRLCHFERFFYSVGTIIEPGQDVTVQIDHSSPPLSPPGTERLPGAQRKQNSGENLPHPPRLQVLCQFSSHDPPQEHARDQEQTRPPGNKAIPRVSHQGQRAGRWNQRH